MQKAIIPIVYHTAPLAKVLADQLSTDFTQGRLFNMQKAQNKFELLHSSDTIIFGCPTYFGTVNASFKQFMERPLSFWYQQQWKNKLAAAFTISSTVNRDKSNTL